MSKETQNPERERKVSHCPSCRKPVLNNGQFAAPVTFSIRCPWCQQNLKVTVQMKVVTELANKEPVVVETLDAENAPLASTPITA